MEPTLFPPDQWSRFCFVWDLWYSCNYRCSYCWWEMDDLWAEMAKKNKIVDPAAWLACWDRIYDLYGTARINIVGGEPLLYPEVERLLEGLTRKHLVMLTTNLSLPLERLERIAAEIPPDRLHVEASFHPQFSELEDLLERLAIFQRRGFKPYAAIVPWPPFLPKLEGWVKTIRERGIKVSLQIFNGRHEGREYPASYAADERSLISRLLPERLNEDYGLNQKNPEGKPCGAGYVYASVNGQGDVQRCGTVGEPLVGNLFDPAFRLWDEPRPCPAAACRCGEYRLIWEEYVKKNPERRVAARFPAGAAAPSV